MSKILVWDLPTRLFHGLLTVGFVTCFAIAQFAGEHSSWFPVHMLLGIVLGAMVLLRVIWGFVGSRYARFDTFLYSPVAAWKYVKGAITATEPRDVGHNPGSSYAIFAMLVSVGVVVATGLLMSSGSEAAEELHSVAAYVLLAFVVVHVLGVVWHTIRHRENITLSMITGRKEGLPADAIRSGRPLAALAFAAMVGFLAVGLFRNYDDEESDEAAALRHRDSARRGRTSLAAAAQAALAVREVQTVLKRHDERHRTDRIGWLRAAVLGANDGIVSTASLIVGVAAAHAASHEVLVAGVAGLVAGAMSMAAGEYVSVSSQADTEQADIERERRELASDAVGEHAELAAIYVDRGLDPALAQQVAEQLMAHDALAAHQRDELGIVDALSARPVQAAFASAGTFAVGAAMPLSTIFVSPESFLIPAVAATSLVFLAILGGLAAFVGGANAWVGATRVRFLGRLGNGADRWRRGIV